MTDNPARDRALDALVAVAHRLDAAARLTPPTYDALLEAVVRTTATVLDAQAASIALHDPEADRLVFVAASGPRAGDVVGLSIDAAAGIAGYAFSTGQPLAVADVAADPRFDRTIAQTTGYTPGTILATPLGDEDGTIGVLEALDRRGGTFSLHDLDVAADLAREATLIVRGGRLERDAAGLLRAALRSLDGLDGDGDIDALVSAATVDLAADADDPTWRLADILARLRDVDGHDIGLAVDWLEVLLRRRDASRGRRYDGRG